MMQKVPPLVLKISKNISNCFNPLFSLLLYFLYVTVKFETIESGLKKFAIIFLVIILPISYWIFRRVKSGKYSDADVSDREQRKSLYYFIIAALILFNVISYIVNKKLDSVMLYLLLLLFLMQISNFFIKSSMHTALNIFTAALFFSQNHTFGIIWLLISFLVAVTRIILKKHTPYEVISGAVIAVLVSFLFLNFNSIL